MLLISVGQHVSVKGEGGIVRFIGSTQFAAGEWAGVELDLAQGRNDGSVQGVAYFECAKKGTFGVFVRPALLELASTNSDVQVVVNKLQIKLQAAIKEIELYKAKIEELNATISDHIEHSDSLESSLEGVTVDFEFVKVQNITLSDDLEKLQEKYDELQADYAILNEELQLNRELEEAVRAQVPSDSISTEDFQTIVLHSKKLEVALSSLKKLAAENETKFGSEIANLKSQLSNLILLSESYEALKKKLQSAEDTITQLQEQLESAMELDHVVEHLTQENEVLHAKVKELNGTVAELKELHEIDKALEEDQARMEEKLRSDIKELQLTIQRDKDTMSDLEGKNAQLQRSLTTIPQHTVDLGEHLQLNEVAILTLELRKMSAKVADKSSDLAVAQRRLKMRQSLADKLIPESLSRPLKRIVLIEDQMVDVSVLLSAITTTSSSSLRLRLHFGLLEAFLTYIVSITELNFQNKLLEAIDECLTGLSADIRRSLETTKAGDMHNIDASFLQAAISEGSGIVRSCPNLIQGSATLRLAVASARAKLDISQTASASLLCLLDRSDVKGDIVEQIRTFSRTTTSANVRAQELLQTIDSNSMRSVDNSYLLNQEDLIWHEHFLRALSKVELEASALLTDDDTRALALSECLEKEIASGLSFVQQTESTNLLLRELDVDFGFNHLEATDVYSVLSALNMEQRSEPRKEEESKFYSQLVEKDSIIEDLQLNIQMLERNIVSSGTKSKQDLQDLQSQLHTLREENREMKDRFEKILEANRELEVQVQSLLESSAATSLNQIPIFEDMKAKKQYTAEMALLEEIALLHKMVKIGFASPQSSNEQDDNSWLLMPIQSKWEYDGSSGFMGKAREIRMVTTKLLRAVITLDRSQKREFLYKRPGWANFEKALV